MARNGFLCENSGMTEPEYIDSLERLEPVLRHLSKKARLAVDLEADSYHHYGDRLCLLQIATDQKAFLVDPLALGDGILGLAPIFADARKEKVFHDGDYDGRMLMRSLGVRPQNIFDTMLAARLLGKTNVGLAPLLEEYFGIQQNKYYQKADWSRRPLAPALLEYAALDTAYLLRLRDRLEAELKAKGRLQWAREEFRLLLESLEPMPKRAANFMRVKGARRLTPRQLAILQALLEWRESLARRMDVPPFKVIGNERLLKIAEECPRSQHRIDQSPNLTEKQKRLYRKGIVKAVDEAMQLPEEELPSFPVSQRGRPDHRAERVLAKLKSWRDRMAGQLGMDPGVLLPNAALSELSRSRPADEKELASMDIMKKWQCGLLGAEVLELIRKVR